MSGPANWLGPAGGIFMIGMGVCYLIKTTTQRWAKHVEYLDRESVALSNGRPQRRANLWLSGRNRIVRDRVSVTLAGPWALA